MSSLTRTPAAMLAGLALAIHLPVLAQDFDFGDDTSRYSKDGECDDSRFSGTGMTNTVLLKSDVGHDASDCRAAFESGSIALRGETSRPPIAEIHWGDDSGEYAKDGECDDARFVGSAMAESLVTDSIAKDASDCKTAYADEKISSNLLFLGPSNGNAINFGDDASDFARNGECDDVRFTGDYASEMIYLVEDIGHDATDCKIALEAGLARWQAGYLTMNLGADSSSDGEESEEAE